MTEHDEMLRKMNETNAEVMRDLKQSFDRYNDLVKDIIETVDSDYSEVRLLKRAILETVSKSLHRG